MLDALFLCNLLCFVQGMNGSRWNILHPIAWEEATKVQRLVGKSVICYPTTHATNHMQVVVHAGDDEVCQFYPHTSIVHRQDSVEYRLQMPAIHMLVDIIGERFQVDVYSIEIRQQVFQWPLTDVTRSDENVP